MKLQNNKKYWFINPCGEVVSFYEEDENPADTKLSKAIGNYFDTREEAEKAVEKLRAWKRLKDAGLHVISYELSGGIIKSGEFIGEIALTLGLAEPEDKDLLQMLFRGEE